MRTSLIIAFATTLAACAARPTMDPLAVDVAEHVGELEAELEAHASAVAAATSVSAIATLDASHRTKALALLTTLDEKVGHMGHCMNDASAAPDNAAFKDALAKLRTGVEGHSAAVAGTAGLTEARAEETRHHGDLSTHVATCKTQSASMKTQAPKYFCDDSAASAH